MSRLDDSGSVIRAGIEFDGRTLRYAEVDLGSRYARLDNPLKSAAPRLLRLGACDFPFDIAETLLGEVDSPRQLDTLRSALKEIFAGSRAEHLKVALHGWQGASFFVPLPLDFSPARKMEHIRQEAALLADSTENIGRLTATPFRRGQRQDGSEYLWHHVLQVPCKADERLETLAGAFGRKVSSGFADASGVSSQMLHVSSEEEPEMGCTLLVGIFGNRVETAIIRNGTWYYSHWNAMGAASDILYFSLTVLDHLKISRDEITRVQLYGTIHGEEHQNEIRLLAGQGSISTLDPLALFAGVNSQADVATRSTFVPSIGAALGRS